MTEVELVRCALCDRQEPFKRMLATIEWPLPQEGESEQRDPDEPPLYAFICLRCAFQNSREHDPEFFLETVRRGQAGAEDLLKTYLETDDPEVTLEILQALAEAGRPIEDLLAGPDVLRRFEERLRREAGTGESQPENESEEPSDAEG